MPVTDLLPLFDPGAVVPALSPPVAKPSASDAADGNRADFAQRLRKPQKPQPNRPSEESRHATPQNRIADRQSNDRPTRQATPPATDARQSPATRNAATTESSSTSEPRQRTDTQPARDEFRSSETGDERAAQSTSDRTGDVEAIENGQQASAAGDSTASNPVISDVPEESPSAGPHISPADQPSAIPPAGIKLLLAQLGPQANAELSESESATTRSEFLSAHDRPLPPAILSEILGIGVATGGDTESLNVEAATESSEEHLSDGSSLDELVVLAEAENAVLVAVEAGAASIQPVSQEFVVETQPEAEVDADGSDDKTLTETNLVATHEPTNAGLTDDTDTQASDLDASINETRTNDAILDSLAVAQETTDGSESPSNDDQQQQDASAVAQPQASETSARSPNGSEHKQNGVNRSVNTAQVSESQAAAPSASTLSQETASFGPTAANTHITSSETKDEPSSTSSKQATKNPTLRTAQTEGPPTRSPQSVLDIPPLSVTSQPSPSQSTGPVEVQSTEGETVAPVTRDGATGSTVQRNADGQLASPPTTRPITTEAGPSVNGPKGPRVQPEQVVDRVSSAIQQARPNGRPLRIVLTPPDLGVVQIEVRLHEGQLSARLETETVRAQQIVLENLPQLRESLLQHGAPLDRIDVQVVESPPQSQHGQHDSRAGGEQTQNQSEQRPNDHRHSSRDNPDTQTVDDEAIVSPTGGPAPLSQLDIEI